MIDWNNWQEYKGTHPRRFVDLVLKNGDTVLRVWPREGKFYPLDNKGIIDGDDVAQIRVSESQRDPETKRLIHRFWRSR